MKKIFLLISVSLLLLSCINDDKSSDISKSNKTDSFNTKQKFTTVSFKKDLIDFGVIDEGKQVKLVYKFTNTGSAPMIVYEVKPGCGCTTVKSPKVPVKVGQEDSVTVVFDSKHQVGIQNKYIIVFYNTQEKAKILSFKGTVKKA